MKYQVTKIVKRYYLGEVEAESIKDAKEKTDTLYNDGTIVDKWEVINEEDAGIEDIVEK